MKKMKKLFSLVMALAMVMSLTVAASATEAKTGTITITNAANGATYSFYKLFTAKVSDTTDAISYTGTIPDGLDGYFDIDKYGQITTTLTEVTPEMKTALLNWAKAQAAADYTATGAEAKAGVEVAYGYYVILSNVGDGSAVSVDSTHPNAETTDKNTTKVPVWTGTDDGKEVNGTVFQMGQSATYTVTLKTVNWVPGENTGDPARKVTQYTISDNFADGKLTNVNVTSIKIGDEDPITGDDAQFVDGKIVLDWVGTDGESLHSEGVNIVITYTATVNDTGKIENTVSASYKTNDGKDNNVENNPKADVYNSTIVVNKYTGEDKNAADKKLAGAKFVLTNKDGQYYSVNTSNVVSWIPAGSGNTVPTGATVVETDGNGYAAFKGLADGTYNLIETEAPDGYNKLTGSVEITLNATDADNDGNHVVSQTGDVQNNIGQELPATGGMGTTIFTVVGGTLMVGAAILFVTKKRSED